MSKRSARMIVDLILTVAIIVSMLVQFTGVTLHELAGLIFFICILIHLILSFAWMKGTIKKAGSGKLRGKNRILMVIALLLVANFVVLAVSSVIISRTLASVGLASALMSSFWKDIHTVSSYAICVLTVVHLAAHWALLFSWLKIPYNPDRRKAIGYGVKAVASVGAVALAINCADALQLLPLEDDSSTVDSAVQQKSASSPSTRFEGAVQDSGSPSTSSKAEPPARPEKESSKPVLSSPEPSSSSSTKESSSAVEGICTLCKKRCPLSAPLCDKPYLAGLIK